MPPGIAIAAVVAAELFRNDLRENFISAPFFSKKTTLLIPLTLSNSV
jgi:hypothetical protein